MVTIAVVNWTAPCTISAPAHDLQANILAMLASAGSKGISAVIMPQFTYKKGQLYLAEEAVFTMMSKRSLDFDRKFGLLFQERTDARDSRILVYDGRIVVPFGTKDKDYIFKDSEIMKGRTEAATMLKSSALQVIENTDPGAPPVSTDVDGSATP